MNERVYLKYTWLGLSNNGRQPALPTRFDYCKKEIFVETADQPKPKSSADFFLS